MGFKGAINMVSPETFYTIFLTVPILGSITLSACYVQYQKEPIREIFIWLPIISGLLTPSILLTFRINLSILGYLLWIALAALFWYGWKKTGKRLAGIESFSLDDIGISEKSTTDADSRGAVSFGPGGIVRAFALVGLVFLYPVIALVLDVHLALKIRETSNGQRV